ncbi:MAG: CPBP family intramembrane metalloprotease [Chitinivibrionales bacterium]|nr:CPBP family intramembrane metalloprotease [Chitinivibrionales bacterium]
MIVAAISEETLFRGYLILRSTRITKIRWTALLIPTGIFALNHDYEGTVAMEVTFATGLALAVAYL